MGPRAHVTIVILGRQPKNRVNVDVELLFVLSDEDAKTLDFYSERAIVLPPLADTRIKAWSLPGLKVVRHKK